MNNLMPAEHIESKIFLIRGQKVMIDRDLAELYGVVTKRLNEQVRRNLARFPEDFMFQLNEAEKEQLVANCDRFRRLKHSSSLPYVFTEQGVAMLSSVLKSERAIQVNIAIMRAFIKLKQVLATHKEVSRKLKELELKVNNHDQDILRIFEALRKMIEPTTKTRAIGFISDNADQKE